MDEDCESRGAEPQVSALPPKMAGAMRGLTKVVSYNQDFVNVNSRRVPQSTSVERMTNEELMMMMSSGAWMGDTDAQVVSEGDGEIMADGHYAQEFSEAIATRKLVIIMVGLPARGKTHIAKQLQRYLNWIGFCTEIFNVGNYRRENVGAYQTADFFDASNSENVTVRIDLAKQCLDDMLTWLLSSDANVAIYDATNATRQRREWIIEPLDRHGLRYMFLESVCTDPKLVEQNVVKTKLFSPDYVGVNPEEAVADFMQRIRMYELVYETIDAENTEKVPYIKTINTGKQIIVNCIRGYIPGKLVSYLLNAHIMSRDIYLSRHGESEWNVTGQLGGDPALTARGRRYSRVLAEFVRTEFLEQGKPMPLVWTSQLRRTRQTVELIPTMHTCWRALNEINAGVCEGMTYETVAQQMPDIAAQRKADKLRFRYPQGESYVDVIHRLEPVILELERQRGSVLIVAHNAVIRSIYAYFMSLSRESCTTVEIPLHTIIKLSPQPYGCEATRYELDVDGEETA
ncbi:6-phosphofructo-2-kinase/fructose-2,6-bisphosphatase [Porphyridium purpureum]|uniref:6-phosphofructo-2-kinase/fructose-2, 6-bisphosphatase n=1 Tax=Porphyridium purpureum TaxID=35688 RepID=A0A5J4Z790_PORPP|nr:6-phosphofructo-2-kinase/fructose-2,6-bisphosphatase [Porphyridium purpureum]|eukprot:POR2810..scf295_1